MIQRNSGLKKFLTRSPKEIRTASPVINEYKYSWYYSPLRVVACDPTYNVGYLIQPKLGTACRQT